MYVGQIVRRQGRIGSIGRMLVLFGGLVLASGPVRAGDDAHRDGQSGGFWGSVLETLDLKTKVGPTPNFVQATHPDPAKLKFIPTSTPHAKRPIPVKSVDEVEAAKAQLDAARDAQLAPKPALAEPPPKIAKRKRAVNND